MFKVTAERSTRSPDPLRDNPVDRALGWSSADYIQIHCGALCAD
jgi:hypothetical protein